MRLDKYGNPVYNSQDLFNLLYQKIDLLDNILVEKDQEILNLENFTGLTLSEYVASSESLETFDITSQKHWLMPEEYQNFDIETYILNCCPPFDPYYLRTVEELQEYKSRELLDLLRWLKYFVDHASDNNIVWGVGRGSSVASYVLFVLGVHYIDSVKYNLDWREFLR